MQVFVHPRLHELTQRIDSDSIIYDNGTFRVQSTWDLMHILYINFYFLKKKEVNLHSIILRHKYGTYYNKMISFLINNNFIQKIDEYIVGDKARTYSLVDFDTPPIRLELNDKYLLKRRGHGLHTGDSVPNNYRILIDSLDYITINVPNSQLSEYHFSVAWMVDCIRKKEWFWSIDSNGRFHSPMTVLKKILRDNIRLDNQEIISLDICNSQPLFLSLLMHKNEIIDNDWDNDSIEGKIYDKISENLECDRKIAKEMVFRALFGRNTGKTIYDKVFKKSYPKTYKWMFEYKKKNSDHTLLANRLQQMESDWIFNNTISKIQEIKKIPIFTVHDSIYFRQCDTFVIDIWNNEIKKLYESIKII